MEARAMKNKFFHARVAPMIAVSMALFAMGCHSIGHPNPTDRYQSGFTELDAYVAEPDPAYGFRVAATRRGESYTTFVLEMTSQEWLTPAEVDRTVWRHALVVTVPDVVATNTAFLMIGGGSNDRAMTEYGNNFDAMAVETRAITAQLYHVPNQPLTFAGAEPRWEDALIAWGWDKYLRGERAEWLARLPMTKAVVRAMDTVQHFAASAEGGGHRVNDFVVAGGSKRGWTAWTTAAVDDRVAGVIPIVIDMLNMDPSFEHHWRAYGFWAPAVGDYVRMGTMNWRGHPRSDQLNSIVEPYSYRDRYTMPKLIMNATGDQFFLPDSSQFYWDQIPNPKYLRYVPNANHGMGGTNAAESIRSFFEAIAYGHKLPQYDWRVEKDGSIFMRTDTTPKAVHLWWAENPDARDFRVETIDRAWRSERLVPVRPGDYRGQVRAPEKGWRAFFVEMTFESPTGALHTFTTEVKVVPDVYPYEFTQPVWPVQPEDVAAAVEASAAP